MLKKAMRDCRQKYRRFHSFAGQPRSKCQTEFCDITFIVLKLCVTKHFVIKCFTFSFKKENNIELIWMDFLLPYLTEESTFFVKGGLLMQKEL